MKLWLIIPVKPFQYGKSRLAEVLDREQRAMLSELFLHNILELASSVDVLTKIIVVSQDDSAVRAIAYRYGASFLQESASGLNLALTEASDYAHRHGADSILILPADLPLITAQEIQRLYCLGSSGEQMVIVPSQDGGTNALLLRPPSVIDFAFGPASCQKHCDKAMAAGIPYIVWQSPLLAIDIDRPDDLWALSQNSLFDLDRKSSGA